MNLQKLLSGAPYTLCTAPDSLEITDVGFDSRTIHPGMAFAAIRGAKTDGHSFIPAAVEAGASLIIAKAEVPGIPTVVTDDPEAVLAAMAANLSGNPAREMTFIGITGTKGKSSTAFFVKDILSREPGIKCGLIGTICNMAGDEILGEAHNTTPTVRELHELLAVMRDKGCTHVIMEVSSHALALERLWGIRFKVSLFTNFSQDHLDFHGTMENYLAAKCLLFAVSDLGIVNADDKAAPTVLASAQCPMRTYSVTSVADLTAHDIVQREADGVDFTVRKGDSACTVAFPVPGVFSVYNALGALSIALALGVSLDRAVKALEAAPGVPGRAQTIRIDRPYRVIVDYAHSPDSVEKIVETVRGFTVGRVISVLGCGGNRDKGKRPKMAAAAAKGSDYVVLTSDNPRFEVPEDILADMLPGLDGVDTPHRVIVDRREAIRAAMDIAREKDTVLIMGKGHENYQEVCGVRHHFDDSEEVRAYAAQ